MIYLPHSLGVLEITGFIAGSGYRYEHVSPTFPPIENTYLLGKDIGNLFTDKTIMLHKGDIPTDFIERESNVILRISEVVDGSVGERYYSCAVGVYPNMAEGDDITHILLTSRENIRVETDDITFPDYTGAFNIDLLTTGFARADSTAPPRVKLSGAETVRIRCATSQLDRSLDEIYEERYYIVTPHQFTTNYRNLYLLPVPDRASGFIREDIKALRVERLQNYGNLSVLTGLAFSGNPLDSVEDLEDIRYTDIDGVDREFSVARDTDNA